MSRRHPVAAQLRLFHAVASLFEDSEKILSASDHRSVVDAVIFKLPVGSHVYDVAIPELKLGIDYAENAATLPTKETLDALRDLGWTTFTLRASDWVFCVDPSTAINDLILEADFSKVDTTDQRWVVPCDRTIRPAEATPCACGCGGMPTRPTSRWLRGHYLRTSEQRPAKVATPKRSCACGCGVAMKMEGSLYLRGHWQKAQRDKRAAIRERAKKRHAKKAATA